jgi:hypothetical protein
MRRLGGMVRARPHVAAALLYALLALAFVSPGLVPGKVISNSDSFWFQPPWSAERPADLKRPANPEIDDGPSVLQPFVRLTARTLPDVPLWNPYIVGGRPFLANAQSAVFSPFNAPSYVLPYFQSLEWVFALKLFLASFGLFLLARALRVGVGGSLVGGLVYGFNLWTVTWLIYPHSSVWVLIPWLLLAGERVVRKPDLWSASGLTALVGVQFLCGHPESSFHAVLVTVLFVLLRTWQARRDEGASLRPRLLALAVALGGGVLLAALVLLPFVELLMRSADLAQRAGTGSSGAIQKRYLFGAMVPDYWGRPTGTALEIFQIARAIYAGALPLMLAGVALLVRPRGVRLAFALLGGVAICVVAGIPPIFEAITALPVFSSGHNTRLVTVYMLAIALLAAWGADDLVAGRLSGRRRTVALAGAAALALLPALWVAVARTVSLDGLGEALAVAWALATPPAAREAGGPDTIRLASVVLWLTVAGAAVSLLLWRVRRGLSAATFVAFAVLLVTVDLFRAGMGYNPAIDAGDAAQPATGAVRYLEGRTPARFVSTGAIPHDAISINFELLEARGYDLPVEERYDRLWRTRLSPEYPSQHGPYPTHIPLSLPKVTPERLRVLSLLGVSDVMQPASDRPLRTRGLRLAYDGDDARVYANRLALPRAWVVSSQRVVRDGDEALGVFTHPDFDARAAAVVEEPIAGLSRRLSHGSSGAARIASYGRESVSIDVRADRPSLLILSDNAYPGWRATVDGEDADVHRVDYVMRGVRVGPGSSRVEFRYEPLSWRIGWIVSLVALLALAALAAVGLRRRRRLEPHRRTTAPGRRAAAGRAAGRATPRAPGRGSAR